MADGDLLPLLLEALRAMRRANQYGPRHLVDEYREAALARAAEFFAAPPTAQGHPPDPATLAMWRAHEAAREREWRLRSRRAKVAIRRAAAKRARWHDQATAVQGPELPPPVPVNGHVNRQRWWDAWPTLDRGGRVACAPVASDYDGTEDNLEEYWIDARGGPQPLNFAHA